MEENNLIFQEKVKNSFLKVKEHINDLEKDINYNKNLIYSQKEELKEIKEGIKELNQLIHNLKEDITPFKKSSIGNDGVFRQTDNRQTTDRHSTNPQQNTPFLGIDSIKKELESKFRSLTDKEFLTFMAIYQLEEEKNAPVTYAEIAKRLKLSQSSVRDHVSELFLKELPLDKIKINNQKVSLFVKKELRDLNLVTKLIAFRQFDNNQKTLFDI